MNTGDNTSTVLPRQPATHRRNSSKGLVSQSHWGWLPSPPRLEFRGCKHIPAPLCVQRTHEDCFWTCGLSQLWGFRHQFCQPDPASFQDRNQQWVLLIWVVSYHFLLSICRLQRQQDIYFSLSPAKIAKLLFSSSEKLELIPVIQRVL